MGLRNSSQLHKSFNPSLFWCDRVPGQRDRWDICCLEMPSSPSDWLFSAKRETTSLPKKLPCFVIIAVRDLQNCFLYCWAFEEKWAFNKILILEGYSGAISSHPSLQRCER